MPDLPANELASTLVSRVVIDLDTIRYTLGKSGGQTELVSAARCQIAGLRLLVCRSAESALRNRLLELLDRMEDEIDSQQLSHTG
jgi:hypothetical protein